MTGRIEAIYDYPNAKGEPRIRKVRREGKQFRMQSAIWSEAGGKYFWARGIRDERAEWSCRALYRLPEIIAALKAHDAVWISEGESDADALCSLGVGATTAWQGADEFCIGQARWFARFGSRSQVIVACDNDFPGAWSGWLRYTMLIEAEVSPSRVRVVAPPVRYRGRRLKDAADALEVGLGLGDMRAVRLDRLESAAHRYRANRRQRYAFPALTAGKAS